MSGAAEDTLEDLLFGGGQWCEEHYGSLTRVYNGLKAAGLLTVGQIAAMSEVQLLRLPNFGRKSVATIRAALASRGLQVGQLASAGPMGWYLSQLGDA